MVDMAESARRTNKLTRNLVQMRDEAFDSSMKDTIKVASAGLDTSGLDQEQVHHTDVA